MRRGVRLDEDGRRVGLLEHEKVGDHHWAYVLVVQVGPSCILLSYGHIVMEVVHLVGLGIDIRLGHLGFTHRYLIDFKLDVLEMERDW